MVDRQVSNYLTKNKLAVVNTTYKALRIGATGSYRNLLRLLGRFSDIFLKKALFFKDGMVPSSEADKTRKNVGSPIRKEDAIPQDRTIKPVDDTPVFERSDFMDIDFLPIITATSQVEDTDEKNETRSKKNVPIPIALNFLPIIVDNDAETDEGGRYRYDPSLKVVEDALVKRYNVVYMEYGSSTFGPKDNLGHDIEEGVKTKKAGPEKIPMSVGEIDLRLLYHHEVSFEQVSTLSENKREAKDSCVADPFFDPEGKRGTYKKRTGEPTLNFLLKPIFLDEYEQSLNQTLDDLEEMGDEREIPLLLEYLEHQNNDMIRDRIHGLLKKFVQWEPKPKKDKANSATEISLPEYNVIRELFNSCDLEAKIILLDSVVDVMGKEDMDFLQDLLDHRDPEIKRKARKGLFMLTERLKLGDEASGNHKNNAYGKMENAASFMEEPNESENPFDFELDLFPKTNDKAPLETGKDQAPKDRSILGELKRRSHVILKKIKV